MRSWLIAIAGVGGLASACGGVDHEIEDRVTIEQGVYGLLIAGCDTAGCQDQPAAGVAVAVYAPGHNRGLTTTSDKDGVYQIDLEAGDYTLCTASCTPIAVPAQGRVRHDWTSGPGGGQWR